ncbi:MAG TPA: hypothetical protein VIQ29_05475 [Ancylobacter sp.]
MGEYEHTIHRIPLVVVALICGAATALASGCAMSSRIEPMTASADSLSLYHEAVMEKEYPLHNEPGQRVLHGQLTMNGYLGRAPYICTPSGFGRKSTCFLRTG